MDAFGGAFARLDFFNDTLTHTGFIHVAAKMNQNSQFYPEGHVTFDDHWTNLIAKNPTFDFGWVGPLDGHGIFEMGQSLGNSRGFNRCMVTQVFREVCLQDPTVSNQALVESLSKQFEQDGYNLKKLFRRVVTQNQCLTQDTALGSMEDGERTQFETPNHRSWAQFVPVHNSSSGIRSDAAGFEKF